MTQPEPKVALTVVIPFFQEAGAAASVVEELHGVLEGLDRTCELILVDDGSSDDTFGVLCRAVAGHPLDTVVRLQRNCGQTAALAAGIDRARGEVLVLLDGDGQNDPADIPRLLDKLDEGFDVVSGWRKNRKDAFITRRIPSSIANALIARLSGVRVHDLGCSLKAYRARYLRGIRLYGEMHRFLVVHAVWAGGRLAEIEVNHRPRTSGTSKYGLERTYKVILDLVVMIFLRRYGTKPIYLFGGFGLLSFFLGFLAGCVSVGFKLAPVPSHKDLIQTPLPLLCVMFGLVGMLSILMGLLAEMMTRTYYESQDKPVYSTGETVSGASNPQPPQLKEVEHEPVVGEDEVDPVRRGA